MGGSSSTPQEVYRYHEENNRIYSQIQRRRVIEPDFDFNKSFADAMMDSEEFATNGSAYGDPHIEFYWETLNSITSPNYYRKLGIDSIKNKEFQEALNQLKFASEQFDNSSFMQALNRNEFISNLNNNHVELYCKWGEELLNNSNYTDALIKFDEALNYDPNNSKAQLLKAKTYATMAARDFESCEYASAYKFYENATSLNSDHQQDMDKSHQCFQLNCDAELQLENENYTEAITKLSQLIAQNPNDQSAKNKLDIAKKYRSTLKSYIHTIMYYFRDYKEEIDKTPQCYQLNRDAETELENENYAEAITKLSQLIALNPNDMCAKNKLEIAKNMKEGIALQSQAEQLLENALEFRRRNDLDNALKYYKKALKKFQRVDQIYAKLLYLPISSKIKMNRDELLERIQEIDENIEQIEILINKNINVNINQEQPERSAEHSVHEEFNYTRVMELF